MMNKLMLERDYLALMRTDVHGFIELSFFELNPTTEFKDNWHIAVIAYELDQVRLALSLLAYNLGNLWRRLALPRRIEKWSLTSLQQRLVKTGGRLVKHARYYWLLLAEGHLNRRRFGAMLGRIALLPVPTG